MRISDWSSDVFSSDLLDPGGVRRLGCDPRLIACGPEPAFGSDGLDIALSDPQDSVSFRNGDLDPRAIALRVGDRNTRGALAAQLDGHRKPNRRQIGRAHV